MRIWLNHWFSTAYRLIENAREDLAVRFPDKKIEFIGTNAKHDCVYKLVCDEFYVEPEGLSEEQYIGWCLGFCISHKINIFVPRRNMVWVSKHLKEFEDRGIKVLVIKDYELMNMLNDKFLTYSNVKNLPVPEHRCVNTVEEFKLAYEQLKTDDNRICIKYARGEGATSFRVIDDRISGIESLEFGNGAKMTYKDICDMLGSVERFDDLLVLPYLKGPEVSIDCLQTDKGLIAVPRIKEGRVTKLNFNAEMIMLANKFARDFKIEGPYNLQLRWHDGIPYLLEVNTRMSGGSHMAYMVGINFLALAIEQLVTGTISKSVEDMTSDVAKETIITQIETPLKLG